VATSTDLRSAIEEVQEQLPAEQVAGELGDAYGPRGLDLVARRLGALPWWMISACVHAVIFLLATLLTVAMPPAQTDEVVISSDVAKQKEPEYDEKKPRDIFRQNAEIQDEQQVEKPMLVGGTLGAMLLTIAVMSITRHQVRGLYLAFFASMSQVTLPAFSVPPAVALTNVVSAGSTSVITTLRAVSEPIFSTVMS